ncbi:Xylanase inhibitor, C-terminal [Sesbania bispinosa]|nr:Xylanase inhibitor, C-terminal [Sesbania bispinosa]
MGVKFTTIPSFFCAIAIYPSTTTCAHDPCASQPDDSDLTVIPIYGKCSPFQSDPNSWLNTIINMASNDPERIEYLSSLMVLRKRKPVNKAPIASGQAFNIGSYVVRVRLGTPGQLMFMVLEPAPTRPGSHAPAASVAPAPPPSPTSLHHLRGPVSCTAPRCGQVRGAFSCPLAAPPLATSTNPTPAPPSPPRSSKTRSAWPSTPSELLLRCINAASGPFRPKGFWFQVLLLFRVAQTWARGPTQADTNHPASAKPAQALFYSVNLTGVTVGRVHVALPSQFLAFDPNTGSGTIIDSGTVITRLIHSSYGSMACLAMAAAPNNVNSALNVIANLQQQNLRILFDTVNNKVGIARELCN